MRHLLTFKYNNSKNCCIAPYSTINFDTMGYIRVCCYNNDFILGEYPNVTLREAWDNPQRKKFIESLTALKFPKGCEQCRLQIIKQNVKNSLFSSFDQYDDIVHPDNPVVFNFDFGSICNYECIMCGGKWSSSIRKNREKLPPLKSPYDENFINQLVEFMPTMQVANFLGGEPFLNSIYYKIWDLMYEHCPNIFVSITTNGSIFNPRIKDILTKLKKSCIVVSLDSLKEETYQFIRKNGNFEKVMKNIQEFKSLGKFASIAFCPMIQNVRELPDIIKFCIDNQIGLGINDVTGHLGGKLKGIHEGEKYNTVVWTGSNKNLKKLEKVDVQNEQLIPEVALQTLPKEELEDIVSYLNTFSFENTPFLQGKYRDFINSLEFFISKKK